MYIVFFLDMSFFSEVGPVWIRSLLPPAGLVVFSAFFMGLHALQARGSTDLKETAPRRNS